MRLADFIDVEMQSIVSRWEGFARTLLPAAGNLDRLALRDHAVEILRAVAADLRKAQTPLQQHDKSRGETVELASETAAQTHAVLRAKSGFTIRQLIAEYRALRASVLRQYLDRHADEPLQLADVGRFNEAIDQAVAESVDYFTAEVDHWRNIFLAVLGHDLRQPLHSIQLTAKVMSRKSSDPELSAQIDRVVSGTKRIAELLDDLLDFNRVSMGGQLDVEPHPGDLVETCRHEVELQRSAHPAARIEFEAPDSCPGVWDASRIRQAVGNLISNAVRYGSEEPIRVSVQRDGDEVRVTVDNHGPTLEGAERDLIFDPLFRGSAARSDPRQGHLGLGLFIVRQAAEAHGGIADVHSAQGQTRFSLVLPRDASAVSRAAVVLTQGLAP